MTKPIMLETGKTKMTKPIMLETCIPFGGFYGSIWDHSMDSSHEQTVEWEFDSSNEGSTEMNMPEELRIDEETYSEILFHNTNHGEIQKQMTLDYVDSFRALLRDDHVIDIPSLKFQELELPKEYNFTTDRIICDISLKDVRVLFATSKSDGHKQLTKLVLERFSHRDGFISFYSNNVQDFLKKPLQDWDCNEIETLMIAVMKTRDVDQSDLEMSIYYDMSTYEYFDAGVEWSKLYEEVEVERQVLIDEQLSFNPKYVVPASRCLKTMELPF